MRADPFVVLGLTGSATAADVHAARRRLAKELHPDLGGDAAAMRAVNEAADAALAILDRATDGAVTGPVRSWPPSSTTGPTAAQHPADPAVHHADHPSWSSASDVPAFTVEALPAECFEALLVVASWIGEVVHDDPPYVLEVVLHEPAPCWCRLDLVPDAGSSSVGISVAASPGAGSAPHVDAVRDTWIRCLNELDWDRMEAPPPS